MSIPAALQTLLLQFQSRYPQGGLCAELLTIHQNQYVVRALVQMGNVTIASAMAAATDLEAAEERAKLRVLECLGLAASLSSPPPTLHVPSLNIPEAALNPVTPTMPNVGTRLNRLPEPQPEPVETPAVLLETTSPPAPPMVQPTPSLSASALTAGYPGSSEPVASTPFSPEIQQKPSPIAPATVAAPLIDLPTSLSAAANPPASSPTAVMEPDEASSATSAKPEKTASRRKAEPAAEASAAVDRSQEVMRIGIEMKRLGWSTEQGREYLKRTYGKRSRQELDDAELLDFLHYLESQPSTLQTPF